MRMKVINSFYQQSFLQEDSNHSSQSKNNMIICYIIICIINTILDPLQDLPISKPFWLVGHETRRSLLCRCVFAKSDKKGHNHKRKHEPDKTNTTQREKRRTTTTCSHERMSAMSGSTVFVHVFLGFSAFSQRVWCSFFRFVRVCQHETSRRVALGIAPFFDVFFRHPPQKG